MLTEKFKKYIKSMLENDPTKIELFTEEIAYANEHELIPAGVEIVEKEEATRWSNAYVERTEKDTVAMVLVETAPFLNEPISFLKKHQKEFVYIESFSFDLLGIDAISLELDDVFGTYTAMLGLKLQKKYGEQMKAYLDKHLTGDEGKYSVAFSEKDGLWDVNFALSYTDGFNDTMTLKEATELAYSFVFSLVESVEIVK